jgi:hypothetical protein
LFDENALHFPALDPQQRGATNEIDL